MVLRSLLTELSCWWNTISKFAILAIASGLVIGTTFMRIPVAAEDHAQKGLNTADVTVHENTGPPSPQDFRFHEGICQGGHTTDVLNEVTNGLGCDAALAVDKRTRQTSQQ